MQNPVASEASQQIDPRAYLRPIWARKWMILGVVVLATALTYVYYSHRPKVYTSATDIFVRSSPVDQLITGNVGYVDDQRNTADQAQLVDSRSVAQQVAKKYGFNADPGALVAAVTAVPSPTTDFVTITARQ